MHKYVKQHLYAIALTTTLAFTTTAKAEPATHDSVKQLMQITGAAVQGIEAVKQVLPNLKQLAPDVPESFWEEFLAEINHNDLENLVIPIYQRHLTEKEVLEIIDFYRTPTGKKLIQTQPQILRESIDAGNQWGRNLAEKILKKYEDYKKKQQ